MKKINTTVHMAVTLFLVMFSFLLATAQQTINATKFPTAAANVQTVPTGKLWTNPQNVRALNNGAATVSLARNGICTSSKCYRSAIIQADHFGFNLTNNDSVVGIEATVRLKASAANSIKELGVQVAFWNSVVGVPINKASNSFWPTQYQLKTFGGQNDTWNIMCCIGSGNTIYCCDPMGNTIIAPDFGMRISVQNLNTSVAPKATIDYVRITIYYISNGARLESQTREAGNISESWEIYPNPVANNLQLMLFNDVSNATVKIFNMQGQLVIEKSIGVLKENETVEIETTSLVKGVYLMQINSDEEFVTKRFVKE